MNKTAAFVKTYGSDVVGVDEERDPVGRQAFRFVDKPTGQGGAPAIASNHQLVEITFSVNSDKPNQCARLFSNNDLRSRHQLVAPALAPPCHARGEIDSGIGLLPGLLPQRDRRVFVLGAIGAK